ncbi:YetF domain-containing protein [Streptomyces bobili]|uniref:YetF domain-containing protein n=1 Tax=Streptomyces bobili TaxID=67280 RepID=UPI00344A7B9E
MLLLQFASSWAATRWRQVRRLLKAEPALLLYQGTILHEQLGRHRVAVDELHQAVRAKGLGGLELVHAVVLETDGSVSVMSCEQAGNGSAREAIVRGRSLPGEDPAPVDRRRP